jgi:PAS domain-containing protein
MSSQAIDLERELQLRMRALSRLSGDAQRGTSSMGAAGALGVLHSLASSPDTALDALALLHELQVYQVEIDIQHEELRTSRIELEASLQRKVQAYDFAPAACFTIDRATVISDLNVTGARLLGAERKKLRGRALDEFLSPQCAGALNDLLTRAAADAGVASRRLQFVTAGNVIHTVQAAVNADIGTGAGGFLVALIDVTD